MTTRKQRTGRLGIAASVVVAVLLGASSTAHAAGPTLWAQTTDANPGGRGSWYHGADQRLYACDDQTDGLNVVTFYGDAAVAGWLDSVTDGSVNGSCQRQYTIALPGYTTKMKVCLYTPGTNPRTTARFCSAVKKYYWA